MRLRLLPLSTVTALALLGGSSDRACSDEPKSSAQRDGADQITFKQHVAPLLARFCVTCHGEQRKKAGLNFEAFQDDAAAAEARKVWEKVAERLRAKEMPPEDKPQPNEAQVRLIMRWIDGLLLAADAGGKPNPGRVTLRRLNRAEYNNTIRDLVGVDFRPADDFPSDDLGYGFDNIGDVLSMPPILMEKYMAAAEKIVEQAIVAEDTSKWPTTRFAGDRLQGGQPFHGQARILTTVGEVQAEFDFPKDGEYVLRARAFGQQAGPEPARLVFRLDGKDVKTVDVTAVEDEPRVYQTRVSVPAGKHRVAARFPNDYYKPDDPDPKNRDRNLIVEILEVAGPAEPARELPETHRRIVTSRPSDTKPARECAREIIDHFATRAYRRPVTSSEVDRLVRLVDLAEADGDSFEAGIQLALRAILVSPHFLFHVELDREPTTPDGAAPISDFELATRLSYFLWSSMPDDELFGLARDGMLRTHGNLEAQVRRMTADRKSKAFVENFAGQWLQTRNVKMVTPDPGTFPAFDDALRAAMQRETELFFEAILREDRSVLEFLDADFTFLDERLARHYGIPGVKGDEFRRVTLPASDLARGRGGVLAQASILTLTSNPTRTSPVKRGKWILETLLGTPPPPPPPDVPELNEEKQAVLSGTLRQRMEQHRANPTCASCHQRMDPLGFGFENFDGVGAWREKDGNFPIDPSGTLPSGESFRGPAELKAILKGRSDLFARCLSEKMLTYALGRGVEYYDKPAIDEIAGSLAKNGYKFSSLVLNVVRSDPFQMRRGKAGEK